ncbi:hypothetical protein L6164_009215 [Bauhinia variegata]|uniref:Uncharacterized protein n=1 Tax=Bauhinia variegata TaxID=167791 RepID=A0ACB9PKB4_BAUVA|nr:hypothetical protein L6164_009215 [Bauhinia variegata]
MNYKTEHDAIEPYERRDLMDFEHHIHSLETEAYSSVLRAFIAQSDLLTWGKEGLMTELRKELNVTDTEHGEILMQINSDELVKLIREQRKLGSHSQDYFKVNTPGPGYAYGSVANSIIKMKTTSSSVLYSQKNMSHSQSSLAAIHTPSFPPKFKDNRQITELGMVHHGNAEQSMETVNHDVPLPHSRGEGTVKVKHKLKKGFYPSELDNSKNRSDVIQIRPTDRVIHDVKKILCSRETPDPVELEKAKLTLREQERSILEALTKVADALERDETSNQMRHYLVSKETPGLGHEIAVHGGVNFSGQRGRVNGVRDSFRPMPSR